MLCDLSLQAAKDIKNKRLDALRNFNKSAYEGIQWIRQNQGKLREPVDEPAFVTVSSAYNDGY
jgi:hypothetical protein